MKASIIGASYLPLIYDREEYFSVYIIVVIAVSVFMEIVLKSKIDNITMEVKRQVGSEFAFLEDRWMHVVYIIIQGIMIYGVFNWR